MDRLRQSLHEAPIVTGTSFTFVGAATTIGASQGLAAVFGAILVTGFVVGG